MRWVVGGGGGEVGVGGRVDAVGAGSVEVGGVGSDMVKF